MPGGCRGRGGVAGFLGAGRAAGVVRGRAWAGRAASAGAVRIPVARRLARWTRARVARRHQRCPRGARSPSGGAPAAGRASAQPPPGGVGRINDDHVQARVGGHLDQPVTEPGGGDARDGAAEPASPPAARGPVPVPLASLGPGPGEVQVLDHERPGAVLFRGGDEGADRGQQPPVTGGGGQRPGRAGCRPGAEDVAVRRDDRDGEMPGVDVDRHNRVPPQLAQRRRRNGRRPSRTCRCTSGPVLGRGAGADGGRG